MQKLWIFKLTRILVYALFRLYFRIEFEGVENIPAQGPVIVAPNHASYLDPFWVSAAIKRPMRYMTWDKMTNLPLLGRLIMAYGAFPVSLEKGDRAALRLSLDHLKSGGGLVIFPEGGRTLNGKIKSFKPGVVRLALDTDAPIVPATIIGAYKSYSPHYLFPRPFKIKVVYHPLIKLSQPEDRAHEKKYLHDQAERLQAVVSSRLDKSG